MESPLPQQGRTGIPILTQPQRIPNECESLALTAVARSKAPTRIAAERLCACVSVVDRAPWSERSPEVERNPAHQLLAAEVRGGDTLRGTLYGSAGVLSERQPDGSSDGQAAFDRPVFIDTKAVAQSTNQQQVVSQRKRLTFIQYVDRIRQKGLIDRHVVQGQIRNQPGRRRKTSSKVDP